MGESGRGSTPLRALVVSANRIFTDRLRDGLGTSPEIELTIGPASIGFALEKLAAAPVPQVVIVDAFLLAQSASAMAKQLADAAEARLILAFEKVTLHSIDVILGVHARGCIETDVSLERLVRAVRSVAGNELWLPRWLLSVVYQELIDTARGDAVDSDSQQTETAKGVRPLTQRELDVLALVRRGLTNKQVGLQLLISPNTVKKHLHSALSKHGLLRRRQLYR